MHDNILPFGIVAIGAPFVFTLLWIVCELLEYYSLVIVLYPLMLLGVAGYFVYSADTPWMIAGPMLGMLALWGLRLAVVFGWRLRISAPFEDPRFGALRRVWIGRFDKRYFFVFQGMGAAMVVLSIPFFIMANDPEFILKEPQYAAIGLWFVGWRGEAVADRQLYRFRNLKENAAKVCKTGLWRFSRHPNYFFEIIQWCAFALYATSMPHGYLAWAAPLLMIFTLLGVTGIPAIENQAMHAREDEYRTYQGETSAFIPWFYRRNKSHLDDKISKAS